MVAHVYIHRTAIQDNICGVMAAPQAPYYWLALATCAQLRACGREDVLFGNILNSALELVLKSIQKEYEANGIPLGFPPDRQLDNL